MILAIRLQFQQKNVVDSKVILLQNQRMSEVNKELPARLRRLIETIDLANLLTQPITASIDELLTSAAVRLHSADASVLVREGETGDLRFLCATGSVADQLIGMDVPAGKGIAGFVLMSGQPVAVSDVGEDTSFYAEVDKRTGFSTQTLLAVPLRFGDEIIGVLEFVNRTGAPPFEPFSAEEMDTAVIYAEAAAALVNAYNAAVLLRGLSSRIIADTDETDLAAIRSWLNEIRGSAAHRERAELALLIREIADRGEAERRLCREILEAVARHTDGFGGMNIADTRDEF